MLANPVQAAVPVFVDEAAEDGGAADRGLRTCSSRHLAVRPTQPSRLRGKWRYAYRAIDSSGRSSTCSSPRGGTLRRRAGFSTGAIGSTKVTPVEVVTDKAAVYPKVLDEVAPAAWHRTERYANNRLKADHGQLKRRLRPMRGLKTDRGARVVIAGHALVQNMRRGHYELALDQPVQLRVAVAFYELAMAI
jgi:transposase-like protein